MYIFAENPPILDELLQFLYNGIRMESKESVNNEEGRVRI